MRGLEEKKNTRAAADESVTSDLPLAGSGAIYFKTLIAERSLHANKKKIKKIKKHEKHDILMPRFLRPPDLRGVTV